MSTTHLHVFLLVISPVFALRIMSSIIPSLLDQEDNVMRIVLTSKKSTVELVAGRTSRRAYFDLGANWANTLRLYKDIGDPGHASQHPWEVYAFEASPLVVPYVDKFVTFLNGKGSKPELLWPPAGSTPHLQKYAAKYGCPNEASQEMRDCMYQVFQKPLQRMVPNTTLMSRDVVQLRVAQASSPPADGSDRFVLVPAAAGAAEKKLHLGHVDPEQMIRGGASVTPTGTQFVVPVADFVSMLVDNFKEEDYVVVKMDIEGGEFEVLNRLIKERKSDIIDVLALECHPTKGDCHDILRRFRKVFTGDMEQELRKYQGWDSDSTPEKYYPIDPRT